MSRFHEDNVDGGEEIWLELATGKKSVPLTRRCQVAWGKGDTEGIGRKEGPD